MKDTFALFKKLVTDRNGWWVPKIESFLLSDKKTIVIVGPAISWTRTAWWNYPAKRD